ncbi:Hypothetical predicted protein [Cloeon dipterum]|uniref:Uncharacterized protein n=1 Tax=Cloeon dipterum TaxID=197152 RepID=A0A8S1DWY5_9INSE|nr:Hypothetical predicted protein [Cloeon dipterum]
MVNPSWKSVCYDMRHALTRHACHDFHFLLCKTKNYHSSAIGECVCKFCDKNIGFYHFFSCDKNEMSLAQAANSVIKAAKQKKKNEKLHKTHISPDDLQLYNAHLEGMCSYHHIHLLEAKYPSGIEFHYKTLATHLNLAFCSFYARRATERSFVTLQTYERRNNYSGKNSEALTKEQQELAERYDVLTSTGKGSTKVLSLLKPEWRKYCCTLADKGVRAAAGIPASCPYLFGTKNGKPMDVRGPQKAAAEACLAEKPEEIRAPAIRITFATTLGQMQLSGPAKCDTGSLGSDEE